MICDTMVKVYSKHDVFIGEFDGIYCTEELLNKGVPFSTIRRYVEKGDLIRIQHGIYVTKDCMDDEWVTLQKRYRKGIFSGYTAMYLQNMSDQIPTEFYMTFPRGYNAKSFDECEYNVIPKFVIPKFYELGITEVETPYGNKVRTYNRERTLCDIVRGGGIDRDVIKQAMRNYLRSDGVDIHRLSSYAEMLHVKPKIHQLVEAMT